MSDTPKIDALCEARHEPLCGLIWAEDVRPLERESAKLRDVAARLAMDLEGLREILRGGGYNPGWGNGSLADWKALKT